MDCLASIDFFSVPTATFRVLYVFVVLRHERRRVVHFNATAHPTGEWTAQQTGQAFPYEEAPRSLIRDRDGIYGQEVQRRRPASSLCASSLIRVRQDRAGLAPRAPRQGWRASGRPPVTVPQRLSLLAREINPCYHVSVTLSLARVGHG